MDRDRRWDRTQAAYDLIVHGRAARHCTDGPSAARAAYERGETDEFITPTLVGEEGVIRPTDSVLCFNFRPDRMRQIVRALAEPGFGEGAEELPGWRGRGGSAPVRKLATMTAYQRGWPYPVAFEGARPATTLGAVIAEAGADPTPRRRDREVRARHLLLQWRPRATLRRRATSARALAARRPNVRPEAADERAASRRRVRCRHSPRSIRASRSSTSPTPTWSVTRA